MMRRILSRRNVVCGLLAVPLWLGPQLHMGARAENTLAEGNQAEANQTNEPQAANSTRSVPTAPQHVTAHWTGTDELGYPKGVVLTWDAVPGATSYNVYRGLHVAPRPAGSTTLLRRGVKGTSFSDPAAELGVDSVPVYQVTAVNASGESVKSAKVEPTASAPVAPAHVTARWADTDAHGRLRGVTLTWDAVPGATSYNVYRGVRVVPRPAGTTTLLKRGVTKTTFTDPDVSMGIDSAPVYQVTAVNATGESAKSKGAEPVASQVALSATQANLSTHSLRLTFSGPLEVTAASDATQYHVQVNSHAVTVQSASYDARTHAVTLVLPAGSLQRGVVTVNWSDLSDTADNPVPGQATSQIN